MPSTVVTGPPPCAPAPLHSRVTAPAVVPTLAAAVEALRRRENGGVVHLPYVHVHSQGAELLASELARGGASHVNLTSCGVGDGGAAALFAVVVQGPPSELASLNLCSNRLREPKGVGAAIRSGRLTALSLGQNGLTNRCLAEVCEAASDPASRLAELDLTATGALGTGAALGDLLRKSRVLRVLRVGSQGTWTAREGMDLLRGVAESSSLEVLDIRASGFGAGAEGAEAAGVLSSALAEHKTLTKLNLAENCIGPAVLAQLSQGIKKSKSLRELNLSANPVSGIRIVPDPPGSKKAGCGREGKYSDRGLNALADAIRYNNGLVLLDLSECALGLASNRFYDGVDHGGVGWVADGLKRSASLRTVDASNNFFCEHAMEDLRDVSGGRITLRRSEPHSTIAIHDTPCAPSNKDSCQGPLSIR